MRSGARVGRLQSSRGTLRVHRAFRPDAVKDYDSRPRSDASRRSPIAAAALPTFPWRSRLALTLARPGVAVRLEAAASVGLLALAAVARADGFMLVPRLADETARRQLAPADPARRDGAAGRDAVPAGSAARLTRPTRQVPNTTLPGLLHPRGCVPSQLVMQQVLRYGGLCAEQHRAGQAVLGVDPRV